MWFASVPALMRAATEIVFEERISNDAHIPIYKFAFIKRTMGIQKKIAVNILSARTVFCKLSADRQKKESTCVFSFQNNQLSGGNCYAGKV